MTEIAPLNTHADLQLGSATGFAPPTHSTVNGYSPALEDAVEDEESSTIRCFCGFDSDDGNTVLCEVCNTWQHIQCYYPQEKVPELHVCIICQPRSVDAKSAAERQRQARLAALSGERKVKRAPGKSHKKKPKDANQHAVQTNGWIVGPDQAQTVDRATGSPRDQPPPAKRPKTSHKSSSSTSALNHSSAVSYSRKRAGSTTLSGQSPTKSPRSPTPTGYNGDYYTQEFMRISRGADRTFTTVTSNSHASISVSNDLRTWLNDVDSLKEVTNGLTPGDVFHRWDRPIEELKQTSPGFSKCTMEDKTISINGQHPVHNWMVANTACPPEAYIGELNGHIGKVEDYYRDPKNRWDELRHPEPFVFFHDKLPIYIDCREEGSPLRFVRRSCLPNVKIQIIIHGTDFHFCFVSMREIANGEELTVPWHIRGKEWETVRALTGGNNIAQEDAAHMAHWFTKVLANFGGCACARSGSVCHLDRFDLRSNFQPPGPNGHSLKPIKLRKTKKGTTQVSPLSTGRATNSRAGSEAVNQGEIEDDQLDSRSMSASSRSKPSSRDITPMGHMADVAVGLGVELSDRERRKLLQQERLFEKMEQDEQGGRKKRNSAGSALNTPSLSTSKQLGFPEPLNPSPTSASSSRPRINGMNGRAAMNGITPTATVRRPRPVYTDSSTQTEDKEEPPTELTLRRRAQGSYAQRLLRRVHEESRRRKERSMSVNSQDQGSSLSPIQSKADPMVSPDATSMPPPPLPSHSPDATSKQTSVTNSVTPPTISDSSKDVEMKDAVDEGEHSAMPTPEKREKENIPQSSSSPMGEPSGQSSHPPIQPPAPPWPVATPPTPNKSPSPRPTGLHVTLPPVPTFSAPTQAQTPTTPSAAGTPPLNTSMSGGPVALSPSSLQPHPPLFSPSIQSAIAPSPMKKKLSLSDYSSRKKKEALAQAQAQQTSSVTGLDSSATDQSHNSSSPVEEKKAGSVEPPSFQPSSSTVIEEVDMPLLPLIEPATADANTETAPEAKPDDAAVSLTS